MLHILCNVLVMTYQLIFGPKTTCDLRYALQEQLLLPATLCAQRLSRPYMLSLLIIEPAPIYEGSHS